ncbi:MAG: trypsin-like peptidase domain-containing protein [Oscillospiraceae bacterium]|nr:trypsin-like peptidase domain-containing protein [Oscillospiraceae bacterium]
MNNDYKNSVENWYAPLEREETVPAAQAPSAGKKRRSAGWGIALGTLLTLGLIIVTSLWFSNRDAGEKSDDKREGSAGGSGFSIVLPDDIPGFSDGKTDLPDEEMPENWKDFFSNFYTVDNNKKEESRIPTVEKRPSWELELKPVGEESLTLQEIYQNCVESIVSIKSYVEGESGYYWGTGIILSEDGLILTNAHLVEGCDSAKITLHDGSEYEAKLVGADDTSDIAVLKIEAKGLVSAVFGESDQLRVGDEVAALGNPLGQEFLATLTDGIVSAIDRGVSVDGHSMNLIQTNTAINEGNSGGALLNMYGQVIGVTNMKMMSSYSSIEGIGFAIPSSTVRTVVNALIKDGEVRGRPAIGVTVGPIPEEAAKHYEVPEGLYVSAVTEGTDAWEKGIREGDIITGVNGKPARTTNDILSVRDTLRVGDTITFTIWREGESSDVEVVVGDINDIY